MDAFRPSVPAPSDLFAAKVDGGRAMQTAPALGLDPVVKSLKAFFDAAKEKQ